MPDSSQVATDLDTRLAEIDGALRAIQAELVPDREPPPPPPPPEPPPPEPPPPEPPPPPPEPAYEPTGRHGPLEEVLQRARDEEPPRPEPQPAEPLDRVSALTEVHRRLLKSSQELLAAYEEVLEELRQPASSVVEVTVTAGPFMSLDAVRAFEAALSTLPGVADVAVRGYERGNRAIVDVQLMQRTS